MPTAYSIHIPCDPPTQTHQARLRAFRIGKHCRIVKAKPDAKTVAFQDSLRKHILSMVASKGSAPLIAGPVKLTIAFEFPHLKSHKDKAQRIFKATRPDLDNMAKTILDALTDAGAFQDDSQVAHLEMLKTHGPQPSVHITFVPLP